MAKLIVVVDQTEDWEAYHPSEHVMTVQDYLALEAQPSSPTLVLNLCRHYRYLSNGYYCSLLAEARGHRVLPSVRTINDLRNKSLYSLGIADLTEALNKELRRSRETPDQFSIKIFFGYTSHDALQGLARQVFEMLPAPILRVEFVREGAWRIDAIKADSINDLNAEEEDVFANRLELFNRKIWRKKRAARSYRYDMAILTNPKDTMPPSCNKALKNFIRAGRKLGLDVELIEKKDFSTLAEYDALFIRETTAIDHHTYRFAKKAENEGMIVIDDPESILRCTNKIYLANLFDTRRVATPKTAILSKDRPKDWEIDTAPLNYPMILKIPDGAFSLGMYKVTNADELRKGLKELFKQSSLILAQEFYYTDYDWRIGIINGQPLFACQYFMSKGHWQIYQHANDGKTQVGKFKTIPIEDAPAIVVKTALKAAKLIGNGLYGVDLKQRDDQVVVMEINDNPNIDAGVEDLILGDMLYEKIMTEFVRRLELRTQQRRQIQPNL
ncbi:MAG: RimK family protein [Gammaproteobacteria bacterium]|nr:RimK family protein [Gammaproteobacteria bacterium]